MNQPQSRTVNRYLQKRADFDTWPLQGNTPQTCQSVVVIPALAEFPGILRTLADLVASAAKDSASPLVIVVVNNRTLEHSQAEDIAGNQQTLAALEQWDQRSLNVAWVDASSAGNELSPKDGVGLARKIGLDWGLKILAEQDRLSAPLICLDGDSRVDTDYLSALHAFFEPPAKRWACVLPYAHPVEGTEQEQEAIVCYESYLRYHTLHLAWAGSPYGYHTIGSTMACTAEAYAAISGMSRRQAGEDFYYLQQLAKTGKVEHLTGTVVLPSSRPSHRVPFGTGRWVQKYLDGEVTEYRLYHPDSYFIIQNWLQLATNRTNRSGIELLQAAEEIHAELRVFLQQQDFVQSWDRILSQTSSEEAQIEQFHRWFDGFRTLKLIHHLRDTAHKEAPMFSAIGVLLERLGVEIEIELGTAEPSTLPQRYRLLECLRTL